MKTLAFLLSVAALVAAPAAAADGFFGPAAQLGYGVVSPDGTTRYTAVPAGARTRRSSRPTRRRASSRTPRSSSAPTAFPCLGSSNISDGLSYDGRTLVVGDTQQLDHSHFLVYDTRTFRMKNAIVLKGTFGFDALSPDASRLYLIQRPNALDYQHYVVRAFDLRTNRLLPGRIADRTQKAGSCREAR